MRRYWLVVLILGFALLLSQVVPSRAGFEGSDPGIGNHTAQSNPNNNHNDPDHGPKP